MKYETIRSIIKEKQLGGVLVVSLSRIAAPLVKAFYFLQKNVLLFFCLTAAVSVADVGILCTWWDHWKVVK